MGYTYTGEPKIQNLTMIEIRQLMNAEDKREKKRSILSGEDGKVKWIKYENSQVRKRLRKRGIDIK